MTLNNTETTSSSSRQSANGEFTLSKSSTISEIVELEYEVKENELFEINRAMTPIREEIEGNLFSFDVNGGQDNVYVAVGKDAASFDALAWTLQNAVVDTTTFVNLIHVFPAVRFIPTPLGNMLKSQLSPAQVDSYMAQERGKRRELLQKFISMCSGHKVKVDTMLIESDTVGKAILELIPVLNVRKLVVGTSKSYSRKSKSRKSGSSIADQLLQHAPEYCNVKVISEGKELDTQSTLDISSPRRSSVTRSKSTLHSNDGDEHEPIPIISGEESGREHPEAVNVTCGCFKL